MRESAKDYEQLLEEERLILAATEAIHGVMAKRGVTRAELARRVGKTRGFVSQVLDGRRNMTLRTLASLAYALEERVELHFRE